MKIRNNIIKSITICLTGAMLASTPAMLQDVNAASWKKNNVGWWWQEDNGSYPQNTLKKVGGQNYYFDSRGYMTTGWVKSNNKWYYFNPNGAMATGWKQVGNTWYYLNSSGVMQTGWLNLGNTWYYLNGSGAMQTGWLKLGNTWYYLNPSGDMVTGWKQVGNTWYYLNGSGAMQTGWLKLGNTWYYLNPSGAMFGAGWHWINGKCYYMYNSGAMAANTWIDNYYVDGSGAWIQSYQPAHWIKSGNRWWYRHADGGYTSNGWEKIGGEWYHFDNSGWMQTGWLKLGSTWYYLEPSGAMAVNKWVGDYYLTSSGAMATSQWIGDKYVDGSGAWNRNKKKVITLKSISLNQKELSLTEGSKIKLKVGYNPTNTTDNKTVSWSSSNKDIATVDKNGTITAKKAGTVTITAKVGNKTASCKINVKAKTFPLISISLNYRDVELEKGNDLKLKINYNPSNTTDSKSAIWSSSDESVATVGKDGTVTAVSDGIATITAKVGNQTATCHVNVYTSIKLEEITLSEETLNWDLTYQNRETLIVSYFPTNTTVDKKVSWSSSDTSIVTAWGYGDYMATAIIDGYKPGTATITATVGDKTATCTVNFTASLDRWYLDARELELNVGDKKQLAATFVPEYTSDSKETSWHSSNNSVATVNENGLITAVSEGTAIITATNANGTTNTCTVYVSIPRIPAEYLSIDKEYTIINVDQQDTIKAIYGPDNTTDILQWDSSDESVAIVEDGVITAVSSGNCTISATIGDYTSACEVYVPYYYGNQNFAVEVFDEINRVRVENGLHAYEWDERLNDYGAKIVAGYNVMTGSNSTDYANHAGQIGIGVEGDIDDAQAVVQAWMDSPMHRGTILNSRQDLKTGSVAVAQKAIVTNGGKVITGTSIIFAHGVSKEELDEIDWNDESIYNIMPEVDKSKIQQYLSIY